MDNLKFYINEQLDILYDFGVVVTEREMTHIKSLKTEIAIENYVQTLIMHKLEK